jgi:hypothetical protein
VSFVDRFRIAVRRFVYYSDGIAKLGPQYFGCNERQSTCTRRAAQSRIGCPNCEFTIKTNEFKQRLGQELKYMRRGTRQGIRKWNVKFLINLVVEIGGVAGSFEGINPEWPVPILRLVSIYRDESKKKRISDTYVYESPQPQKAILKGPENDEAYE